MHRREALGRALAAGTIGLLSACGRHADSAARAARDISGLDSSRIAGVVRPATTAGVAAALRAWRGAVCIAGARFSMGGQTREPDALQFDLSGMDRMLRLDTAARTVRVQAGMHWRRLQALLDPHDLAIKVMQSYSNFSVGGSVSVNCHGRYVGEGAIAGTVRALQLVTAEGRVLELSRDRDPDLFGAALGGYGGLGVITEVELDLAHNARIGRQVAAVPLSEYPAWFRANVLGGRDVVMHNADLVPPDFDAPLAITWSRTDAPLTDARRLVPEGLDYSREQNLIWSATELPGGDALRDRYMTRRLLTEPRVIMRNCEASLDVASIEPRTRRVSTYLLQEYFIPMAAFDRFTARMRAILRAADADILNVSIRHAIADTTSLMRWADCDMFCFVLYHKQRTWQDARAASWTRALIDAALDHGGRYYLPYRLHATRQQFARAYPQANIFAAIKREIDPANRFRNLLWDRYLSVA
ncbi:FAD/FMN-containing dehydrogenase [Pseudoxanthomonas sp. 3HH-4]|uniref:FAD-binding oxidoreductase n=1 Tax=Pseudoxanthomonas sp. 3HH-4 TaxID=1690214 RepID=UPI001154774C|nr:FAD-binding oxidoreductase [Pseudoxanthomonas sp. 3HH-4]TQM17928.1 FAD/FMN-containing dehydrogenase [Pseudoxanthomonas sp. 3HH-4]